MLDTNTFLSIGFALITNFSNVLHVPPEVVPKSTSDLQHCVVGSPRSRFDLHLVHQRGTLFWIEDGAVVGYRSPGSFFNVQNLELLDYFRGPARLSTNEVVALAEKTARRLVKHGEPFTNGAPQLLPAGHFRDGEQIPFYRGNWPGKGLFGYVAQIEVDARDGSIPALWVGGPQFRDLPYLAEISNRVWRADPPAARKLAAVTRPPGSWALGTNEAAQALANARLVLARFKLQPGPGEDLSGINWQGSGGAPGAGFQLRTNFCFMYFTNGARIYSAEGRLFSYGSADGWNAGSGTPEAVRQRYYGRIAYHWKLLARDFESVLCRDFGFTEREISGLVRLAQRPGAPFGQTGDACAEVIWAARNSPQSEYHAYVPDPSLLVYFDLLTGTIKSFTFRNDWRDRFMKAQSRL